MDAHVGTGEGGGGMSGGTGEGGGGMSGGQNSRLGGGQRHPGGGEGGGGTGGGGEGFGGEGGGGEGGGGLGGASSSGGGGEGGSFVQQMSGPAMPPMMVYVMSGTIPEQKSALLPSRSVPGGQGSSSPSSTRFI